MQYVAHLQSTLMYSKLYPKMIDNPHTHTSYQPPKFQLFDEKGNSKQYAVYFIETCNNAESSDQGSNNPNLT